MISCLDLMVYLGQVLKVTSNDPYFPKLNNIARKYSGLSTLEQVINSPAEFKTSLTQLVVKLNHDIELIHGYQ